MCANAIPIVFGSTLVMWVRITSIKFANGYFFGMCVLHTLHYLGISDMPPDLPSSIFVLLVCAFICQAVQPPSFLEFRTPFSWNRCGPKNLRTWAFFLSMFE